MDKRKLLFGFLAVLGIIGLPSFIDHVRWFMVGHVEGMVVHGRWDLALLNIGLFLIFLIPLSFRKKIDWKSMSVYVAFIVSLFVEMYGTSLTIYLSSTVLFSEGLAAPPEQEVYFTLNVLGQSLAMTFWKIVGSIITIAGMAIVLVGWTTLYRKVKEEELVTSGIYRFSRHPQYLGIILISLGWFIHWPSLLTLAMLPVLVYFYYKLTVDEEEELLEELEDPEEYLEYKEGTPRFI